MDTNVRPCPRLAEDVCILEELPAARPLRSELHYLGFEKVRIDSITNFLGHVAHDFIPLAKARQRRCRIR